MNGSNDDLRAIILQLTLQNCRGDIAVGSALFKTVIFLHGLVVQILSVDHEQHLIDVIKPGRKLCRFEGSQRFSAARGVPDVSAACNTTILFIIIGDFDAV